MTLKSHLIINIQSQTLVKPPRVQESAVGLECEASWFLLLFYCGIHLSFERAIRSCTTLGILRLLVWKSQRQQSYLVSLNSFTFIKLS